MEVTKKFSLKSGCENTGVYRGLFFTCANLACVCVRVHARALFY